MAMDSVDQLSGSGSKQADLAAPAAESHELLEFRLSAREMFSGVPLENSIRIGQVIEPNFVVQTILQRESYPVVPWREGPISYSFVERYGGAPGFDIPDAPQFVSFEAER